jgi:cardiolipin synthase A/B
VIEAAAVTQGESQRAAVMYGSPSLGSTSAERYLALTLSAARETLYITSAYFVPSGGFRAMLCKAAENGVDVRVLTPGRNTDQPSARYAGRVHYEELLRRGVRVYEYAPTMLHAKTIVADRVWASVGSINFDNRSLKLNDEVTLVAQDEGLGCAMQEMFLRDLTFAQEVVLNEFARRPRGTRLRERAAWLIAPLL